MIITFSFNDQEAGDFAKAERMQKADALISVISSVQRELKTRIKHGELTSEKEVFYEEIQDLIYEKLAENNVDSMELY